ncbi:ABC transporter substrate-binding protein [Blautia sp. MSJ-9]|uniref:ABC transporter substrate-binding protein n=1 Tax=Blautia sp. MSJ-9 TaxID=2841511 RepID=UPI001C10C6B8|nr:ABC transporter substrate-binding protein [Blautia sp. MSJ-9]MBU5681127.1 ABC transporter substrate-binding protein [Blautia sp. MSJ-9]
MRKNKACIMAGILVMTVMTESLAGCKLTENETQTAESADTVSDTQPDQQEKTSGSEPDADTDVEKPEEIRDDVVIYSGSEPETLDQHDSTTVATAILIRNLYANLYRLDSDGNIVPELAESSSVNDDYTEYTITLKEGLQFSDGSPLTASDVVYTYRRGMDSEVTYYQELKAVEAKDDQTVVITLSEPNNEFLNDLTVEYMCVMSEAAIEEGMDVDNCPDITSGAYTVEKWNKGESIVLKANPYYFDGEADIKTATILYRLQDENVYQALQEGSVDYLTSVSVEQVPYLRADENIELISYDNFAWNFLTLNEKNPYFEDQNVRRAIYYALDLNYIIETALDGLGTPAPIMVNGSIAGYVSGCDSTEFDLNKAKEYMAKSAYPDGFDLTIKVGDDVRKNVAEEIGTLLAELGIKVTVEMEEMSQVITDLYDLSYEAAIISYSMSSGTVTHAVPLFKVGDSMNFAGNTDGEIADLLEQSVKVEQEKKTELLTKAYQLMKEKNIYIGLYWPTVYDAKNENLEQKEPVTSEKFIIANMYWE